MRTQRLTLFLLLFSYFLALSAFAQRNHFPRWENGMISFVDSTGKEIIPWMKGNYYITDRNSFIRLGTETGTQKLFTLGGKFIGEFDYLDEPGEDRFLGLKRVKSADSVSFDGYLVHPGGDTLAHLPGGRMNGFLSSAGIALASVHEQWHERKDKRGSTYGSSGGTYGYIRKDGSWILPAEYEQAQEFSRQGWGLAQKEGKWFSVDSTGKTYAIKIEEGIFPRLHPAGILLLKAGKQELLNWTGESIYNGIRDARPLGDSCVAIQHESGNWSLMSREGKTLLPEGFSQIDWLMDDLALATGDGLQGIYHFSYRSWLLPVSMKSISMNKVHIDNEHHKWMIKIVNEEGKTGFMDLYGQWLFKPQFDRVEKFYYRIAQAYKDGKMAFIHERGTWVTEHRLDGSAPYGSSAGTIYLTGLVNEKTEVLDTSGKTLIPPNDFRITPNPSGIFIAWQEGRFGLIDQNGREVLPVKYERILHAGEEAVFWIKDGEKWGVFQPGEKINWLKFSVARVYDFQYGYANVAMPGEGDSQRSKKVPGKVVLVDMNGEPFPSGSYDMITPISPDLFWIFEGEKVGVMNREGTVLLKPAYQLPEYGFQQGYALLKYADGSYAGYISEKGKVLFNPRK